MSAHTDVSYLLYCDFICERFAHEQRFVQRRTCRNLVKRVIRPIVILTIVSLLHFEHTKSEPEGLAFRMLLFAAKTAVVSRLFDG